jgi:ribosome-binding protein aMBF1 (putative translation factor)
MNMDFRIAIIRTFGSQIVASRRLKIQENKLSHFVHGHSEPNERERKLLEKALGHDYFADVEESRPNARRNAANILASEAGNVVVIVGEAEAKE